MEYILSRNYLQEEVEKPKRTLEETYNYINAMEQWNLRECSRVLDDLYQYQLEKFEKYNNKTQHISNEKIDFYIKYMEHKQTVLKGFESHLLSLIATIFLPLSFIVGFFGMNFKSMGVPSLTKGIFTIKHAAKHLIGISFITSCLVIWFFYSYLKLL